MEITDIQVKRKAFAETRIVSRPVGDLADGDILARVDMFALTANNVSYALSGEGIGYWKFYPAAEPWGVVPVWGFADVIQSRHPDIAVGERIWGFMPMSSHVVMTPGRITARSFVDVVAHRQPLPPIYNSYQRTSGDPPQMKDLEVERFLLFPLFSTSYVLYDYLVDNAFFDAEQVLVGSASSKTGYGLCSLLFRHQGARPRVVGLTSPRNQDFVRTLGVCDEICGYDEIDARDPTVATAFVDMAGNGDVVAAVHSRYRDGLKLSCAVGATHWEAPRFRPAEGGVPHTFFFAPGQFLKREQDWGPGEVMRRATAEAARMALDLRPYLNVRREVGAHEAARAFSALVANETMPDVGVIARVD